jgi:hypothetical protein
MKNLQGMSGEVRPDLPVRQSTAAGDLDQIGSAEEDLSRGVSSPAKKSASDIGIPPRTFLSEPTEGLVRFCSMSEMMAFETPARFASSRCESPLHLTHRAQPLAEIEVIHHLLSPFKIVNT